MALEGEQRIVAQHAAAVVGQTNQPAAAGLDVETKFGRAGVERIFEQFLDDARRTFDDLARRDFVGDDIREYANPAHVSIVTRRAGTRAPAFLSISAWRRRTTAADVRTRRG